MKTTIYHEIRMKMMTAIHDLIMTIIMMIINCFDDEGKFEKDDQEKKDDDHIHHVCNLEWWTDYS